MQNNLTILTFPQAIYPTIVFGNNVIRRFYAPLYMIFS